MTGFGKCDASFNGKKIHVEIRSLNSKSLDLTTRVATLYREKEMEIRKIVAENLQRGKIDLLLWVEKDAETAAATLNAHVIRSYAEQIENISEALGMNAPTDLWRCIFCLPEVTSANQVEILSDEEWKIVEDAVHKATEALIEYRITEGQALERKFCQSLDKIEDYQRQLVPYEESRVPKIRQRIEESLAELKGVDYDRGRLEQEMIYYIEKLDINEEKQRLTQHLKFFRETMAGAPGQGKKLAFIAQEMGREINTTGSKSNQAEMQLIVVGMKDELEQIKEQVLNVL